ncbi:MAG: dTDP-4-dehydrorhamnose 3,5-epimerase [Bacteroidota bacterium]
MNFEKVYIDGLLVVTPDTFQDERGYFFESFNKERYKSGGIDFSFVQDNLSKSKKGTIRGLHYQVGDFAQGKLCSVIIGKVLDIAVDIRFGSPTFGKYYSSELSEENKKQLWIPPGFAHGFSVLSDESIFSYKCTKSYNRQYERSIIFNDELLNIGWHVETPIVSPKDMLAKKFTEIEQDFIYKQE